MIRAVMTALASSSAARRGPLHRLGPLRSMLVLSTLLIICAAPFADGSVHHDWRLIPGVIAPTVMMMLVFALPLDMTMAKVFMSDASVAERQRLRFAIRVEACALVAMLAAWTPFVLGVLDV
jgi:hypothetical protein